MNLPKFKENLVENVGTLVKIVERGNVSTGNFGITHWHKIALNGQIFDHGASEAEMKALGLLNVGEEVQAVKKKNSFGTFSIYWSPKEGAEARMNANPQPMGNTALAKQDKQIDEYKSAQDEKGIAICLQGFMQQILPSLVDKEGNDGPYYTQDQCVELALDFAVKAREALLKKAKEIHTGIPGLKYDPITAAEALKAFAPDNSATL